MVSRVGLVAVSVVTMLAALGVLVQTGETNVLGAAIAVVAFFWWDRWERGILHAHRDAAVARRMLADASGPELGKKEGRAP